MTTPNSFSGSAAATTLTNSPSINSSATSFTVNSTATWLETIGAHIGSNLGTSGNFVVTLDYGTASEEKVLCSSISTGNVINVATGGRGYDGTTATTHYFGATVVHTISTDVPYQANLGVTNAAAALTAANTVKSNIWQTALTGTGPFSATISGITGYANYLIMAFANAHMTGSTTNTVTKTLTVNGTAQDTFGLSMAGGTYQVISSQYGYAAGSSTSFAVSYSVSGTSLTLPTGNFGFLTVIGYN